MLSTNNISNSIFRALENSEYDSGNVIFNREGNNFVVIKFNEDFDAGTVGGSAEILSEGNYTISSSDDKEVISEKRALALSEFYFDNYQELKKKFNLPGRIDFAFSVASNIEAARP